MYNNFRDNARRYHAAIAAGGPARVKKAANFKNCVHDPLIKGAGHEKIIDLIYIPELHIHIGITNRLVRELNSRWEERDRSLGAKNPFYKWCHRMNIQIEDYRSIQILKCSL